MDKLNIKTAYREPPVEVYKAPIDKNGLDAAIKQILYGIEDDFSKISERINWLLNFCNGGSVGTASRVPYFDSSGNLTSDSSMTYSTSTGLLLTTPVQSTTFTGTKVKLTVEGGIAVKLTNKTGAVTVKGEIVRPDSATDSGVVKIVVDIPSPIGVFYESGIAADAETWVVISGIADVYFTGNTTRGYLARGFITSDGAGYVTGQALAEAYPSSPHDTDKHFYEIGHVLESRVGAGLAKCVLHFN